MNETASQQIVREWAIANEIGVDGMAVVWRSTYQCGSCERTLEYSGCGHCGPPGALGIAGDAPAGALPNGLCRGGTALCVACKEISERRVTLEFVDERDRRYNDLIDRLSAALDEKALGRP